MRVLMISLDRGLLRDGSSGDVVARHQRYADLAGSLDVIVFAPKGFQEKIWSRNLRVFPTGSSKFAHYRAAQDLADELCRENKYELLVTQEFAAPAGAKIKKKCRLPWLVNIHSMFFSSQWLGRSLKNWFLFFLIRGAVRSADGFRVTNNAIKKKIEQWGISAPVLVQPTPVDVEKFKNQRSEIKNINQKSKLTILFVGRLSPEKNVGLLIAATKDISSDFELNIVGEGSEAEALKKLAAGDERIRFLGPKNHEELREFYATADIFVLPSDTESFGKVLVEAGAAGCALLATRTSGAESIIRDGENGVLVDVGDEQALRRALKELLENDEKRSGLGRAAREMARGYDAEAASEQLVEFWRKIAKI